MLGTRLGPSILDNRRVLSLVGQLKSGHGSVVSSPFERKGGPGVASLYRGCLLRFLNVLLVKIQVDVVAETRQRNLIAAGKVKAELA